MKTILAVLILFISSQASALEMELGVAYIASQPTTDQLTTCTKRLNPNCTTIITQRQPFTTTEPNPALMLRFSHTTRNNIRFSVMNLVPSSAHTLRDSMTLFTLSKVWKIGR